MSNTHNILVSVLCEENNVEVALEELRKTILEASDQEYTVVSTAYRVCRNYQKAQKNGMWEDFCSNLRQYKLYSEEAVYISDNIKESINKIKHKMNIDIINVDGKNELIVNKTFPSWMQGQKKLEDIYNRKNMRDKNSEVVGDSFLYYMTGYKNYRSQTQKILVDASFNMPNGSTVLGCMATGQGKSLVGIMPQYYEEKGLTIIIVPTVSLAIDQQRVSMKYYKARKYKPVAHHSGLTTSEKNDTFIRILRGDLPILYISPEGLLNNTFRNTVLEAASKGLVNRLVIDEAHIIEDWGTQFRTEFQLLSSFRKDLLAQSDNKLKTILLSATYTESSVKLLKNLFSENEKFIEIRGDALRPEIQYYFKKSRNYDEKFANLMEVIYLLPRPIIIYTIKPDKAEEIRQKLEEMNIKNTKVFTGRINAREERETIIQEWVNNDIDIIIATSAFGMGVDKKDVRTVIHYSIPESINRFYQEVGRGGRDGLGSVSLLLTEASSDLRESNYFISSKVISVEKFLNRWYEMYEGRKIDSEAGSFWIDANAKPKHLEKEHIPGNQNISWNENILLTLFKDKLIDILGMNIDHSTRKYLIRINNNLLLTNPTNFEVYLQKLREKETEHNKKLKKEIHNFIIKDMEGSCMGKVLANIYKETVALCSGCSYCSSNARTEYRDLADKSYIKQGESLLREAKIDVINREDRIQDEFLYYYNIGSNLETIINKIIGVGINHLVFGHSQLLDILKIATEVYVAINPIEEISKKSNLISGVILIVYSDNRQLNEELYELSKILLKNNNKIIHLCTRNNQLLEGESIIDRTGVRHKFIN